MKSPSEADRFGAELAARLAAEEENRFQGMPSDGDSRAGYRAMGESGWIGLHWPEELGGRGLDPLLTVAAEERFGYHWLPLSGYLLSVKTIGNAMLGPRVRASCRSGSSPRSPPAGSCSARASRSPRRARTSRRSGRPRGATATASWCPATRSGPRARRSRTGSTSPCARTRRGAPHRGISVLVAEMGSPGIEVREIEVVGGGVPERGVPGRGVRAGERSSWARRTAAGGC